MHSGLYYDETAELCHWHVPAAHYLESWGDARAYDGTIGIIQPLIAPLYDGNSAYEIDRRARGRRGKVRARHRPRLLEGPAPGKGQSVRGVLGTLAARRLDGRDRAALNFRRAARRDCRSKLPASRRATERCEIVFRPDPTIFDGRFANNGWLQELPKPITKLTWDNAAMVSPATAQQLALQTAIT